MSVWLLLVSVGCLAFSGVPGLLAPRRWAIGQWIDVALNLLGSAIGCAALVWYAVSSPGEPSLACSWSLPLGRFSIGLDGLSLLFLIPIFVISALGSVYGLGYWRRAEHPESACRLRFFWGLMAAGMALVVLARDGVLFLMAWEFMALAGFFLMTAEDDTPEIRQAGWVYLVATHAGTLCLMAFFVLLSGVTGSSTLWPASLQHVPGHLATWLFVLGVVGFGFKAGLMPLHVWLPGAHANAPSHVSAIFSGVLLKTGIYGIVRVCALLPEPPLWWGASLLIAGAVSGVLGIAFALAQRDLKRLLAYSSIENIGIITMGIGLALLGRTFHRTEWVILGMGGALLHVLNHSLFKPLLFMGAGAVLHAVHTRQIDLLGGLGRRMPRTFVLFAFGAVAICGLPPLNGFVSELLIYLGLFRTAQVVPAGATWVWAALAAPALALVGALAVAGFVKLLGIVFGGEPRSAHAAAAHDPGSSMLLPMGMLAVGCLLIGLFPAMVTGILDPAIRQWASTADGPTIGIASLVPFGWLTVAGLVLLLLVAVGVIWVRSRMARRPAPKVGTWDCGYARPTARMQYTGSSFAQLQADLFNWILWPRRSVPRLRTLFAERSRYASDNPDTVLDRCLMPVFRGLERLFTWAHAIQRGQVQIYLLYVLAVLFVLLLFLTRP